MNHDDLLQEQRDTIIRLTEAMRALTSQLGEMRDDLRLLKDGKVFSIYVRQQVHAEQLLRLQWIVYGCIGGLGSLAGGLLLWALTKL
jgi:hypothetical protein